MHLPLTKTSWLSFWSQLNGQHSQYIQVQFSICKVIHYCVSFLFSDAPSSDPPSRGSERCWCIRYRIVRWRWRQGGQGTCNYGENVWTPLSLIALWFRCHYTQNTLSKEDMLYRGHLPKADKRFCPKLSVCWSKSLKHNLPKTERKSV